MGFWIEIWTHTKRVFLIAFRRYRILVAEFVQIFIFCSLIAVVCITFNHVKNRERIASQVAERFEPDNEQSLTIWFFPDNDATQMEMKQVIAGMKHASRADVDTKGFESENDMIAGIEIDFASGDARNLFIVEIHQDRNISFTLSKIKDDEQWQDMAVTFLSGAYTKGGVDITSTAVPCKSKLMLHSLLAQLIFYTCWFNGLIMAFHVTRERKHHVDEAIMLLGGSLSAYILSWYLFAFLKFLVLTVLYCLVSYPIVLVLNSGPAYMEFPVTYFIFSNFFAATFITACILISNIRRAVMVCTVYHFVLYLPCLLISCQDDIGWAAIFLPHIGLHYPCLEAETESIEWESLVVWYRFTLVYYLTFVLGGFLAATPASSPRRLLRLVAGTSDTNKIGLDAGKLLVVEEKLTKEDIALRIAAKDKMDSLLPQGFILKFPKWKTTVILDASGNRKSALLRAVADEDQFTIQDKSVSVGKVPGSTVCMCPDYDFLWGRLTVRETLNIYKTILSSRDWKERMSVHIDPIDNFDLRAILDIRINRLTPLEKKLTTLAVTFLSDAQILIFEDPTRNLHFKSLTIAVDYMRSRKGNSQTVVMTCSSGEDALRMADRVAVVVDDKIRVYGTKHFVAKCLGIGTHLKVHISSAAHFKGLFIYLWLFAPKCLCLKKLNVINTDIDNTAYLNFFINKSNKKVVEFIVLNLRSRKEEFGVVELRTADVGIEMILDRCKHPHLVESLLYNIHLHAIPIGELVEQESLQRLQEWLDQEEEAIQYSIVPSKDHHKDVEDGDCRDMLRKRLSSFSTYHWHPSKSATAPRVLQSNMSFGEFMSIVTKRYHIHRTSKISSKMLSNKSVEELINENKAEDVFRMALNAPDRDDVVGEVDGDVDGDDENYENKNKNCYDDDDEEEEEDYEDDDHDDDDYVFNDLNINNNAKCSDQEKDKEDDPSNSNSNSKSVPLLQNGNNNDPADDVDQNTLQINAGSNITIARQSSTDLDKEHQYFNSILSSSYSKELYSEFFDTVVWGLNDEVRLCKTEESNMHLDMPEGSSVSLNPRPPVIPLTSTESGIADPVPNDKTDIGVRHIVCFHLNGLVRMFLFQYWRCLGFVLFGAVLALLVANGFVFYTTRQLDSVIQRIQTEEIKRHILRGVDDRDIHVYTPDHNEEDLVASSWSDIYNKHIDTLSLPHSDGHNISCNYPHKILMGAEIGSSGNKSRPQVNILYRKGDRDAKIFSTAIAMETTQQYLRDVVNANNNNTNNANTTTPPPNKIINITINPVPLMVEYSCKLFLGQTEMLSVVTVVGLVFASSTLIFFATFTSLNKRVHFFRHFLVLSGISGIVLYCVQHLVYVLVYCHFMLLVYLSLLLQCMFHDNYWLYLASYGSAGAIALVQISYALSVFGVITLLQKYFYRLTVFMFWTAIEVTALGVLSVSIIYQWIDSFTSPLSSILVTFSPVCGYAMAIFHVLQAGAWQVMEKSSDRQYVVNNTANTTTEFDGIHYLHSGDMECLGTETFVSWFCVDNGWDIVLYCSLVHSIQFVFCFLACLVQYIRVNGINKDQRFIITSHERNSFKQKIEKRLDDDRYITLHNIRVPGKLTVNSGDDGISSTVGPLQCLALYGDRPVSGTSAILESIIGLGGPSEGHVEIGGELFPQFGILGSKQRICIGYCPQWNDIDPVLTGRDVLMLLATIRMTMFDPDEDIDRLVSDLGLIDVADTQIYRYSNAEKRKLRVAMALVGDPGILILDHPTQQLDLLTKVKVWNRIREFRWHEVILILATDCPEECCALGTSIMVLKDGQIKLESSIKDIKRLSTGYFAYVWLSHDRKGNNVSVVRVIRELQRRFRSGMFSLVDCVRDPYIIFSFANIILDLDHSKIYDAMEDLKDHHMIRRYLVQEVTPSRVVEAYKTTWMPY